MDRSEIHKGLPDSAIRDFLARARRECRYGYGDDYLIQQLEMQIAELKIRIEDCKKAKVIDRLIADRGWDQFDISDHIKFDDSYFDFIGTKEEADERFPDLQTTRQTKCQK